MGKIRLKNARFTDFDFKEKLPTLMRSVGAEGVIIADKSLSKEERLIIVDQCLEFNYKVYIVPLIAGKIKRRYHKK
jgi:hypothetical protein